MADFGQALMLLGMGMQGNSQGINDFFAKRQEAERNAKINELMSGLSGSQADRLQQLGALAQLDPNTFARSYIEETRPLSPLDELQLQKNRLEVENMRGERDQKAASEAAARRALGIGGGQQQTPNFNPALGNQVQPSSPDSSALSQLGIPLADNINSRSSENLGLPNPSDIQAMAQQLLQARTQGALVTPVTQEALPPMAAPPADITQRSVVQQVAPATAQPAEAAPRIATPQEWAARPENQTFLALGNVEAAKGYNDYVKREQENATKLADEQRKIQTAAQPVEEAKKVFNGALEEIKTIYDQMRQEGTMSTADQNVVERGLTSLSQPVLDPARKQVVDGLLARIRLSLMQATGMSAQVFNSNTEMQSLMKALSTPSNTYEANVAILDSLSKQYGTGGISQPVGKGQQPTRLRWNQRTGAIE